MMIWYFINQSVGFLSYTFSVFRFLMVPFFSFHLFPNFFSRLPHLSIVCVVFIQKQNWNIFLVCVCGFFLGGVCWLVVCLVDGSSILSVFVCGCTDEFNSYNIAIKKLYGKFMFAIEFIFFFVFVSWHPKYNFFLSNTGSLSFCFYFLFLLLLFDTIIVTLLLAMFCCYILFYLVNWQEIFFFFFSFVSLTMIKMIIIVGWSIYT